MRQLIGEAGVERGDVDLDFAYSQWSILEARRPSDGATLQQYVDGAAVDEHLELARYLDTSGIPQSVPQDRYFYHADLLGSVAALTDEEHVIVESYIYSPYGRHAIRFGLDGELVFDGASSVSNTYTYTGRQFSAATTQLCYRYRIYDASCGRFISQDPIGYGGGLSLYGYVGGNPLRFTDPLGQSWVGGIFGGVGDIIGGIGRVIGGGAVIVWDGTKWVVRNGVDGTVWAGGKVWDGTSWVVDTSMQLPSDILASLVVAGSEAFGAKIWRISCCQANGDAHTVYLIVGGLWNAGSGEWGTTIGRRAIFIGSKTLPTGYSDPVSALADPAFFKFIAHECGHVVQAKYLGPLYIPLVGPLTGWSYGRPPWDVWETGADNAGASPKP